MSDFFTVTVPMENVNDEFATIVEWNISSGSEVRKGDIIVTLETMKATFEMEAEEDGYLFYDIDEGAEVGIGSDIAYICKEKKRPEIKLKSAEAVKNSEHQGDINISAKAARLMKEYGLRSEDFEGFEKVRIADVEARISEKRLKKKVQSEKSKQNQNLPSHNKVQISASKRYEIQQLSQSNQRVVASSVSKMLNIKIIEKKIEKIFENERVQVTIIELIIFEIAKLLKKYRFFNGFYDNGSCMVYDEINIGFAVNIGKGLKVPVIKNADQLSLKDISSSVKDLSLKYFREELSMDDLGGGTFTVTDLSAKGIIDFYPVINNMQSAILGVCSVVPDTDNFKVILTFDHNMADGMIAADMLNELSTLLQG